MIGKLYLNIENFRTLVGRTVIAIVATTIMIATTAGEAISQQPSKAFEDSLRKNRETYKDIFAALDRKDFVQAEKILYPLVRRRDAFAEIMLSMLYLEGASGVPKKVKEGLDILTDADKRGNLEATHLLAGIHAAGKLVPKNTDLAKKMYEKSAAGGNIESMKLLASAYQLGSELVYGRFVNNNRELNYREALRWYMMAAKSGDDSAQWNVGFMYKHGQGVPQSIIDAYVWYSIAAANHSSDFYRQSRDNIARDISPSQLLVAQGRAKKCMASEYKNCDD